MRITGYFIFILLTSLCYNLTAFSQITFNPKDDSAFYHVEAEKDSAKTLITFGDTRITGFKKTKLYIIQREIPFRTGDVIPETELKKKLELCRQQLMNTALFVDVTVSVARREKELIFIDIVVKERWYLFPLPYFKLIDPNLNTWWVEHKRSLDRVNYGLKFMQNNVSGRNDNLNIWLVNGYTQQVSLRYENPFLDKSLKNGMNIGFSYSRNHEINYMTDHNKSVPLKQPDEFLTKLIHVDLSYSYRPAIKTRHIFKLSYTNQSLNDTVIKLNPKFFNHNDRSTQFFDFTYILQYFNVDYIPYPLKGFMGDTYFYKRGIGAKNNMWQVGARGDYSFSFLPKTYMQFQATGLIKLPFNQPYYAQGMFGSSDFYMRGLEYYVIDGVAGGVVRATAKREVLSFNVKSPILNKTHDKIPFRIFLKTYGDAGYGYNKDAGNSMLNNKFLYTGGAGVDIVTIYDIVVKLEYSYNQLGESGFFIHTKSDF